MPTARNTSGVAYERQRAYGRVLASGIFDPAGSTPSMPILILRVPRTRREDGGGDDNGIGDADGLNEQIAPPGSGCRYPSRHPCLHALAGNGSDLYDFSEIINRLLRHVTAQTTKAA